MSKAVSQSLDEFVEQKQPHFYRLDFVYEYNHEQAQYLLRLPISSDGKRVTNVVSIVADHLDMVAYHELIDKEQGR